MKGHIIALFIGSILGLFAAALCSAAARGDQ